MQILRREWDILFMAVIFKVEYGQDKYFCLITEKELDPENSHPPMNKKIAEDIFDSKKSDIEVAAAKAIAGARARGIKHKFGQKNDPLPISLPTNNTAE